MNFTILCEKYWFDWRISRQPSPDRWWLTQIEFESRTTGSLHRATGAGKQPIRGVRGSLSLSTLSTEFVS